MPPKGSTKKPLQKATVIQTPHKHQSQFTSTVHKRILERIQKCLDRAHHSNTSEAEAKAALFVSQKLMSQHNVSQADLMAADENSSKAHYGGRSVVSITKIAGSSVRAMKEAFTEKLARAMCTLFDCKYFSTDYRTSMQWTFFGITDNTAAAAMGFEMAHNKILEWACAYKSGTPTFSYRFGVVDGLAAVANREKRRELDDARRKELEFIVAREREEAAERQREVDRLLPLPAPLTDINSPSDSDDKERSHIADSGDDGSDGGDEIMDTKADFSANVAQIIDLTDDVDETINKFIKREPTEIFNSDAIPESSTAPPTRIKSEPGPGHQSLPATSPWDSGIQLVQFRATAEQVADDYLKQNKIKLHSSGSRSSIARDRDAYRQGQLDSSKIKVHR
ncbi:hypothetical protein NUU61_006462 [Penicillium alfredii]|uniref:DUF2786 domain-containing protein n=1 Tax=Penicillium alfredii TaxID=1506179 RepID=A0A9W9K4A0_9EURO|nr:uncharacterized protein NUU61_006462 [Penicillium alfredii]KAJ5091592.1 hypothetical protein NUU61_006462 [Penicillium alfredii]